MIYYYNNILVLFWTCEEIWHKFLLIFIKMHVFCETEKVKVKLVMSPTSNRQEFAKIVCELPKSGDNVTT